MDFNLTDEQQMLRDAANRFVREQYGFEARRRLQAAGGASTPSTGRSTPRWAGSRSACRRTSAAWAAASSRRRWWPRNWAARWRSSPTSAARCWRRGWSRRADAPAFAAQRRGELLEAMAGGALQIALAHSEPAGRYELDAASTTRARRRQRLRARRHQADGARRAGAADQFIVSAQVAGEGLALFLVGASAATLHGLSADRRHAGRRRRAALGVRGRRRAAARRPAAGLALARGSAGPRRARAGGRGAGLHGSGARDHQRVPEDAPAVRPADRPASRRCSTACRRCSSRCRRRDRSCIAASPASTARRRRAGRRSRPRR